MKIAARWCAPCRLLEETFKEIELMDEFKDYTIRRLDLERNQEEAERYGVRTVPTTLFLKDDGTLLKKLLGNLPKEDLIELLRECAKEDN